MTDRELEQVRAVVAAELALHAQTVRLIIRQELEQHAQALCDGVATPLATNLALVTRRLRQVEQGLIQVIDCLTPKREPWQED